MKKLAVGLLLVVVVAAGTAAAGYLRLRAFLDTPVTPPGGEATVEVAPGTSLRALGRQLEAAGVVKDRRLPVAGSVFYLWAHKLEHAGDRLKSGDYLFRGPATPRQILDKIVRGEVRTYTVTLPEGLRLDEIMPLFEQAGLARAKDLLALAHDPAFVHSLGVEGDSLEGYVFPDTYTFAKGLSPKALLARTVARFDAVWDEVKSARAPSVNLDRREVVTLASIIEKETGSPAERPRISCVFHNRMKRGMKLQTDPTVIYAKILRGAWDGNITRRDLETPHPYNTYTIAGLPPGPIASPGEAALRAALHPDRCNDLFFVARGDGTHVFCPDYACHERAVARYQLRRRRP